MTYFQNVFPTDYEGIWTLADRQHSSKFKVRGNFGRGQDLVHTWTEPSATNTYDLSGNDGDGNSHAVLIFNIAMNPNDFRNWVTFNVTVSGATPAATTVTEIMDALNVNATFSTYFTASIRKFDSGRDRLFIHSKLNVTRLRFFMSNGRAEAKLGFNARAGVAELPTYFHRHIIWRDLTSAEQLSFTDGVNLLIELSPDAGGGTSVVDDGVIYNAVTENGTSLEYDASTITADWELLGGSSGLFMFTKNTHDGSLRITESIQYHAGAVVGDLGRRIVYTYVGAALTPTNTFEMPHTLESGDLITPP